MNTTCVFSLANISWGNFPEPVSYSLIMVERRGGSDGASTQLSAPLPRLSAAVPPHGRSNHWYCSRWFFYLENIHRVPHYVHNIVLSILVNWGWLGEVVTHANRNSRQVRGKRGRSRTQWVWINIPSLFSKRLNFSCLIAHLHGRNDAKSYLVRLLGLGKLLHV